MQTYPQIQAIDPIENKKEQAFIKLQKQQLLVSAVVIGGLALLNPFNISLEIYAYALLGIVGFILFIEPVLTNNLVNVKNISDKESGEIILGRVAGVGPYRYLH